MMASSVHTTLDEEQLERQAVELLAQPIAPAARGVRGVVDSDAPGIEPALLEVDALSSWNRKSIMSFSAARANDLRSASLRSSFWSKNFESAFLASSAAGTIPR